jgi:uncharacterized protein (TIGR03118 family)
MRSFRSILVLGAAGAVLTLACQAHAATEFYVSNLVSDGYVPAGTIDPKLINPWGIARTATSPLWVSDNGSGIATVYNGGTAAKLGLAPTIAPPNGQTFSATPTGQVATGSTTDFLLNGNSNSAAAFIFDTEDGTISGWSNNVSPTSSVLKVDNYGGGAGAVYKGLAISGPPGTEVLYAANFRSGNVEMYNNQFGLMGTFTDPSVMSGYAPFNVQVLNGNLYVAFALQDSAKHDDMAGAGNGYVDEFSLAGVFEKRLVSQGGQVNSPWGLDIAPASFGTFAGDLLVGNFGDGTISAFDPVTGTFVGTLDGRDGKPLMLGDLWALTTGNGGAGGSASSVYFTTGIVDEAHGLLGSITPVPEPATWAIMIAGMGLMGMALRRRRGGPSAIPT